MLLLGHRGARRYAPENTIDAFELTLEHGCNGIEFDVRRTLDGHAVVCHDPHVRGHEVAGSTFESLLGASPSLPLLRDVLKRFHSRAFLYIELKVAGLEQVTLDALRESPPQCGYVVASFLADVLSSMRRAIDRPGHVPLGFISKRGRELALWPELPVNYIMPKTSLVTPKLIRTLHDAGKQVIVWTVNGEREMRAMAEMGVDGILSDDTLLLSRTLTSSTSSSTAGR